MMRRVLVLGAFLSALWFPWPLTVCVAIGVSLLEPLVPLAIGLLLDILYFVPPVSVFPHFTVWGAAVTMIAFFVHSRLKTSIIER